MKDFDLIVLGSGSGLDVASGLARRGKDVAVVETGRLGGTCLNRGCIPSKMLIHRADVVQTIRGSERFGIDAEISGIDFEKIVEEVNKEVHGDSGRIEKGLEESDNHSLYREEARFIDENILELKDSGEKIKADKIVIAAGSRPLIPPVDGREETDYWVSSDALDPDRKPDELIIIGGGYVSLEMAHFYDAMGTSITIVEREERLLSREDRDIAEKITELARERYEVLLEVSAREVYEEKGRKKVVLDDKEHDQELEADEVMFATGRVPNTDSLQVENAGIETTDRGFIDTDSTMKTSVEGIYALGDIADNWMFKHSANHEAETVFRNIVSEQEHRVDYPAMPHAVFTDPQIAGVGKTEQQLEEEDREFVSVTYDYSDTGMGGALKEEDGFVKVLASGDGKILGCHIIGPDASQLIHEVLVAMKSGTGNVTDIRDTIHIHPALNEVVQRAFSRIR